MEDYYIKVQSLPEDKLVQELEKLNKQIMKISPSSPIYNQVLSMLNMAQEAYSEIALKQRIKPEDSKIIEIGTIEEEVLMPDYDKSMLINAVIEQYRKG
jgi:ribosomal protein L20A (L18A)